MQSDSREEGFEVRLTPTILIPELEGEAVKFEGSDHFVEAPVDPLLQPFVRRCL